MDLTLRFAARSNVGLGVKSRNEDSGYAGPHLLVLADGMGGHAAGDVASSLVIGELVHLDGESHGGGDALDLLASSLRKANTAISRAILDDSKLSGMGTTTVAMLRTGSKLALANIGDSRGYLLRDGVLTQITHDHSFVQSLIDEGRITEEEAQGHPQRSLVTRVLTGRQGDEPDLSMRELRAHDRYLICSDGLSDFVAAETIEEVLTQGLDPAATAERLIEIALRAGTRDNVTVLIGDVVDSSEAPQTNPEIVGAAAGPQVTRTRSIPLTPAAKAAALSRRATGADVEEEAEDESLRLAEEGPPSGARRWIRRVSLAVVVGAVLVGGSYAAYDWSQGQYFVGEAKGRVAIYQGVSQNIGPWQLSHVIDESGIAVADLPDFYRGKVTATVTTASLDAARRLVTDLRVEAVQCQAVKAAGGSCDSSPGTPTPTTTGALTPGATPKATTLTPGATPRGTTSR